MPWDEQIESGFPAPDSDEPKSLRQDILDELADHLECAMNRELLKDGDAENARARMLARFGDPIKIVKRLWLDAMQEKLMSKRLSIISVSLIAISCFAACGLTWSMVQELQRNAEDARQASLKLIQQGEDNNRELMKQNQAIIKQLATIAEQDAIAPRSLDWNPFDVKLVMDDAEGSPASDFEVSIRGHAHTASEEVRLEEHTDIAGMASFGVVRPGSYFLEVVTPWGERRSMNTLVKPGSHHVQQVVCPAQDAPEVAIDLKIEWPENLPDDPNLALAFEISRTDRTIIDENVWRPSNFEYVVLKRSGELALYKSITNRPPDFRRSTPGLSVAKIGLYGAPRLGDALNMNGRAFAIDKMQIIYLTDGKWPGNDTTIENVELWAPCSSLRHYTYSIFRTKAEDDEALRWEPKDAGPQIWTITIPDNFVSDVLAVSKSKQHSTIQQNRLFQACSYFIHADADGNLELSESECENSSEKHHIRFSQFPVSYDKFITTYAESRRSR